MKRSGDIHLPEIADDELDLDTRREKPPAAPADVAFLAAPDVARPFWHRDRKLAVAAMFALGGVLLSLFAARKLAR